MHKEHIIPNDGLKSVLFAQTFHKIEVLQHNLWLALQSVFIKIMPASKVVCFIHTDMDNIRRKRFSQRGDHPFNERFNLLIADIQYIINILVRILNFFPHEKLIDMRKGLNTRYQLHTEQLRIAVGLLQILNGIPAAQCTEIRFALNLIHIFHIEHEPRVPHKRHFPDELLEHRHMCNGIAGKVKHQTVFCKKMLFPEFQLLLRCRIGIQFCIINGLTFQQQHRQSKIKMRSGIRRNFADTVFERSRNLRSCALFKQYRNTVLTGGKRIACS